jgi:hypothetical protein
VTCPCREGLELIAKGLWATHGFDTGIAGARLCARQALAKPCECEKPERCYDANCSMPNGHPGMHYDKRDGVAWGAE